MHRPLFALALLVACESETPQNTAEIVSEAVSGNSAVAAEAGDPAPGNSSTAAASRPTLMTVGALQIPYDAAQLSPVEVRLPLPPDWKEKVEARKLISRERAALIGRAECMYGQSGEASRCHADQEAGLAFAALPLSFAEAGARMPADERKSISLAGAEGLSWEIGAEGEGAEYILLPADGGTILIVRQFRSSGNPDEGAIATVLSDMRLKQ